MKSPGIKGEITEEVIEGLVTLVKTVIGDKAVIIIKKDLKQRKKPREDKLFLPLESVTNLLGIKGAFATLRQVGRELSKVMISMYPKKIGNSTG